MNQDITHNIKPPNFDLDVLKKNFAHCFDKDGNFDFEKFKNHLSQQEISFSTESYGLDWLGKSYARLLASDPATTLLKEDNIHNNKPENINAQNLLIKGDNLEVLKHLANAYYEQVKMIYIDPPYNTGSDGFVYQDDRKFTLKELQNLIGINEEKANRILTFTKQKSNSHSAWLTFIYPRLYIAKQLLKEDGVIFISIDDNEVAQLRLLMDEVFGEENFVAELPTIMNLKGNNDQFAFSGTHEYTIVYSKNKEKSIFYEFTIIDVENEKWEEDNKGFYKIGSGILATSEGKYREDRPYMYFPILIKDNNITLINEDEYKNIYNENDKLFNDIFVEKIINKYSELGYDVVLPYDSNNNKLRWTWGYDGKFKTDLDDIIILKTKNGISLNKKQRPSLGDLPSKKPKTIFYKPEYSSGNGTTQLKELLSDKIFQNPKPIDLILEFLKISSSSSDLILDFFAGSGTTGDAVMQLNAEDGGNRKYILVQIPEAINPQKSKTAYDFVKNELHTEPTIFEITKERLLRAANKINEGLNEKINKLQKELPTNEAQAEIIQLKHQITQNNFKIIETIPIWDNYYFEADQFENTQTLFNESTLTEDDLKALLITWKTFDGIALTQNLESIMVGNYPSFYGNNKLYLMHKGFTTDTLKILLEKIDADKSFSPSSIIAFGYNFESARLRELAENIKSYANKKNMDIDFIIRY